MIRTLILGLVSGTVASLVGLIYDKAYAEAFWTDFSLIINPVSVFSSMLVGTMIASIGYHFIMKLNFRLNEFVFNLLFGAVTFGSILMPLGMTLPLEVDNPEMFAGLAIPLHFFPMLFWLSFKPLFKR